MLSLNVSSKVCLTITMYFLQYLKKYILYKYCLIKPNTKTYFFTYTYSTILSTYRKINVCLEIIS